MGHRNEVKKFGHPGRGKNKTRFRPKGRGVEPKALMRIRELIGDMPQRRDLLIEYLHVIQDAEGYLSAENLAALAQHMRLSLTEVYEVATFYAHFDVVREQDPVPAPLTVRVCEGIACELAGARQLYTELAGGSGTEVRIQKMPCMGRCDSAPVAEVGHHHQNHATAGKVSECIQSGRIHAEIHEYIDFDKYVADGGYTLLKDCLSGKHSPGWVIGVMSDSGLRGLGGAGFPTGRKWEIVRGFDGPRLLAVNGDEGEPGTFKDRYYLERDPHRFIEGMLIAAWVIEAETSYLYLRDEYPAIIDVMRTEIDKLVNAGLAQCNIEIRRGAGAYICGEESAMIESIEGKRGLPRHRPPYIAEVGLFGRPTLENNVETLYWVRDVVEKGADWFTSAGRNGRTGLRSFSVSGRVRQPGVKFAPAGITIQELIDEYCGGMLDGHIFKGYLPGGASGGILPASLNNIPLDFDTLQEYGCFIGSAAVVVFSNHDDMKDVALNLMRFFEDESCGQCTPCRVGCEKSVKLIEQGNWDRTLMKDLVAVMTDASICGLGQAAGNPINSVLRYFPEELT